MKTALSLIALLTSLGASVQAATIVYNFNNASNTVANFTGTVSGADASIVTAGTFGASGDANVSASTDNAYLISSSSASTQAGALSSTHYLTFTITPTAGQTLQLNSFNFNFGATNYAAGNPDFTNTVVIQTSAGGLGTGGTILGTTNGTKTTGITTQDTPSYVAASANTQGITFNTPLTVQIRFFDDSALGTAFNRIDDITLNVSAVPEPSAAIMTAGAAALALGIRRRRA